MKPMSSSDAVDLLKLYLQAWQQNRERLDWVDRWFRGQLDDRDKPHMPSQATKEHKGLRDRSMTRWLKLAVAVLVQELYVEGCRTSAGADAPAWEIWQRNQFDSRQIAIHQGALAHGLAYVTVLPGDPVPKMRGVSARTMMAFYQDPADDEWPMYALAGKPIIGQSGTPHWRFRLYDDVARYTIDTAAGFDSPKFITHDLHNTGVCPVVRYANELDLDGRSEGEVEPNIDMAARIDQDTFDRLVVQRFGAWLVRYIAGMTEPGSEEEKRATKLRLSVEDILIAEKPETKFGTLEATSLDGFIKARDSDIRDFAACLQVPPHDLLGAMVNLSAEALAAAEAGKSRKVTQRKHVFGESHEQSLNLAAFQAGLSVDPGGDAESQVVWADMESRSLAQASAALGILATQLGIPPQALWSRIPGVTQTDVKEWRQMAEKGGAVDELLRALADGQSEQAPPVPALS